MNQQNKEKNGKFEMFKYIVKDEGMAFDDASQRLNYEGIACTPMTTFKFIIKRNEGIAQ